MRQPVARVAAAVIAINATIGAIGCQRDRGPAPPEVVSRLALPQLDGNGVFAPDQLRGHRVLVNFWAPWCTICVGEFPELAAAVGEAEGTELVLVMVWGNPDEARAVLRSRNLPGVALVDATAAIPAALGFDSIPHTIAVDRQGRSVVALHGGQDRQTFRQVLDSLD